MKRTKIIFKKILLRDGTKYENYSHCYFSPEFFAFLVKTMRKAGENLKTARTKEYEAAKKIWHGEGCVKI